MNQNGMPKAKASEAQARVQSPHLGDTSFRRRSLADLVAEHHLERQSSQVLARLDATVARKLSSHHMRKLLQSMCLVVAPLTALLALFDVLRPQGGADPSIVVVDLVESIASISIYTWARAQRRQTTKWAHAAGALLCLLVVGNLIARGVVYQSAVFTMHLVVALLACGSLLLSLPWLLLVLGAALTGWGVFVFPLARPAEAEAHVLAVLAAVVLAVLIFRVRIRALSETEAWRIREEEGRRKAEAALEAAEKELVERRLAEAERDRMQAELIQAQKMEAIGTLAGGIAHDMNNVLVGIVAVAELVDEQLGPDHALQQDMIQIIGAAKRGSDLMRNLLSFGHKRPLRREAVKVDSVVREVHQLLERTLPKKVSMSIDCQAPDVLVEGDATELSQALINLCLNAVDAMPAGGPLRIATARIDLDPAEAEAMSLPAGASARIEVEDRGTGMDQKTLARVFEPFFTTKPVGKGSGLGLSMVYGTVRNHNGTVAVESTLGRGTRFIIHIPVTRSSMSIRLDSVRATRTAGSGTILLVDDDRVVRAASRRVLKRLGYQVIPVESGTKAVEVFAMQRDVIDLVILDMSMPEMDGPTCFAALRRVDPHVKVLVCSGYAPNHETEQLLAQGAAGFLEKPYTVHVMGEAVAKALGRNRSLAPAPPEGRVAPEEPQQRTSSA